MHGCYFVSTDTGSTQHADRPCCLIVFYNIQILPYPICYYSLSVSHFKSCLLIHISAAIILYVRVHSINLSLKTNCRHPVQINTMLIPYFAVEIGLAVFNILTTVLWAFCDGPNKFIFLPSV